MTDYYIDQEDIISDFIRVYVVDPKGRAEATDSNTITATASQTDFTITAPTGSVSCITSVTIDGTTKKKYLDFYWDYQNSQIIFFTALTVGQEVIANFKYGSTNWCYSDKPSEQLGVSAWPRISTFLVSGNGRRLGQYEAPVESSVVLQIDIWSKSGEVYTIDGRKYSDNYLGRYLANQITKAFEEHEEDLFPVMYNYTAIGVPRAAPYAPEYQAFHTIIEANFKGLRMGRITVN